MPTLSTLPALPALPDRRALLMARFPSAIWRGPVPNRTPGAMSGYHGLVLHIQQGTETGTDAWFHDAASKVSAHFGNPRSGPLDQWVDTADMAWAEVDGNPRWISVENEGAAGDALTASQLENAAQLLAWLHRQHGVPLQISDDPATVPGLTGHGLGGAAWGGHYDCPGTPILGQRSRIIARTEQILGLAPTVPGTATSTATPTPTFSPQGDTTMGTIPATIATKWPDIADQFPANAGFDDGTALIWSDAGARAAALYAQQARDIANAVNAKVDALTARLATVTAPTPGPVSAPVAAPVDVNALAAAIAPHLTAGATADQIAQSVAAAFAKKLGQL